MRLSVAFATHNVLVCFQTKPRLGRDILDITDSTKSLNEVMATRSTVVETVTETETREENPTLKLKLKKKKPVKKIQWTADTVDNEGLSYLYLLCCLIPRLGLGKKKSKVCCQYTKPRSHLDESSSEEEEEDHDCQGH